jgi:hypothetical protein
MTDNGSPAGLDRALASGRTDQIDMAISALLHQLGTDGDATAAIAACNALMHARHFDAMLKLADGAARLAKPADAGLLWPSAVQALIELGGTNTAERLVDQLLAGSYDASVKANLYALQGRMKKSEFVATGNGDVLREALRAYVNAYQHGADPLWAGVNAIALKAAAERHSLEGGLADPPDVNQLLALAATAPMPRSAWSLATELELRLARGEQSALVPLLTQMFDAHDESGFVDASLLRQLHDVWELEPADPLLVALGEHTLASGTGEVMLPKSPLQYEKMFDGDSPIPIVQYREGLDRARSVGTVLVNKVTPWGTIFAMNGTDLHPTLADRIVLVTNEHVVPDPSHKAGVLASEILAQFAGVADADGTSVTLAGMRAIWHSVQEELDVTLMLCDDPQVQLLTGPPLAADLPVVRPGQYVYVIGNPGGSGIQLSIRGNDLVDHDHTKIHYMAPTDRGSSGSPVFDASWSLIGVHHAGSDVVPNLNGRPGTGKCNEGISIFAIREALAAKPPTL